MVADTYALFQRFAYSICEHLDNLYRDARVNASRQKTIQSNNRTSPINRTRNDFRRIRHLLESWALHSQDFQNESYSK